MNSVKTLNLHWFCTQNKILSLFWSVRACTNSDITLEPYPRASQIWCQKCVAELSREMSRGAIMAPSLIRVKFNTIVWFPWPLISSSTRYWPLILIRRPTRYDYGHSNNNKVVYILWRFKMVVASILGSFSGYICNLSKTSSSGNIIKHGCSTIPRSNGRGMGLVRTCWYFSWWNYLRGNSA